MSPTFVLRIPRSDAAGEVVLAHVTPSTAKKAKPLDVKLVATEGEEAYSVTLEHSKIQRLKSGDCDPDEWEEILLAVLVEQGSVEDIELTAAVKQSEAVITVRKRIQNITQRLGAIKLPQKDNEEDSDVTLWCGIAVEAREKDRANLAAVTAKAEEYEQQVKQLRDQMDEFIKAKKEHEDVMLQKFATLLNSKKLKVRQYQKALREAGIDPESINDDGSIPQQAKKRTAPVQKAQASSSRKPAASRSSKRKAAEPEPDADGGEEVDAVKMEYEKDSDRDLSEDQKTTDDDATASEPDSDGEAGNVASNSNLITPAGTEEATNKSGKGKARDKTPSLDDLPAKRALPFARQNRPTNSQPAAKPKEPSPPLEGSETESDDEL